MPDETVFRLVVEALVHGSGYERVATAGCSDWTIRNRVKHWATLGLAQELHRIALAAYDKVIGLDLSELSVDGCHTKASCQGDRAGPSPVDRAKQGIKRSTLVEGGGIPIGLVSAGTNRHDSVLLGPTIDAARSQVGNLPAGTIVRLDSAYDGKPSRQVLGAQGLTGKIARRGVPAPIQVGKRWVVERTQCPG